MKTSSSWIQGSLPPGQAHRMPFVWLIALVAWVMRVAGDNANWQVWNIISFISLRCIQGVFRLFSFVDQSRYHQQSRNCLIIQQSGDDLRYAKQPGHRLFEKFDSLGRRKGELAILRSPLKAGVSPYESIQLFSFFYPIWLFPRRDCVSLYLFWAVYSIRRTHFPWQLIDKGSCGGDWQYLRPGCGRWLSRLKPRFLVFQITFLLYKKLIKYKKQNLNLFDKF